MKQKRFLYSILKAFQLFLQSIIEERGQNFGHTTQNNDSQQLLHERRDREEQKINSFDIKMCVN